MMTQSARAGFKIDQAFPLKVGSRLLYHNSEKLYIAAHNKSDPQARFSRVNLGGNAFVWCPTNKAGERYLTELSPEDRDKFLYHVPPASDSHEPKPESRRVVVGSPIKALPNGRREADYFNASDGTPLTPRKFSKSSRSVREPISRGSSSGVTSKPSEEAINAMRERISAGTFGK